MAFEGVRPIVWTFPAGADLSAAANQYKFVKQSGANVVLCAAVTDVPIGVLQNTPKSGEEAEVLILGISKVQADAALATVGTEIGTSADGQAAAVVPGTDTTHYIVGRTLQASGGAGELIACAIDCVAPARAA